MAQEVAIVRPGDGEVIELGPIRIRVLEDGGRTGHRLAVCEATLAPRSSGPPLHRHAGHDEGFYVLSGTVRFTTGDRTWDAPPGTLVLAPTDAPHTFANPADEPATFLATFTPDLFVQYFRDLRDALAQGEELDEQLDRRISSRYATAPVHTP
ncbi:cupin domain-containing protein [Streptomyces sp. NRRL S-340]|uniref:cupin domain-containing protein n=1 Tax=Streptomyces sp. NRRL S-340 TaxID=1463901 RepID=UPI000565F3E5|nr:cupin domain-containing protein [Streptomyces sp. NRRL S-340]